MDSTELKSKTVDQLKELLTNLRKETFNLRVQKSTGTLEATSRMRIVRRNIARVKTVLNEIQIKGESNA